MTSNETPTVSELPPETIDFAYRMFDAARGGNAAAPVRSGRGPPA